MDPITNHPDGTHTWNIGNFHYDGYRGIQRVVNESGASSQIIWGKTKAAVFDQLAAFVLGVSYMISRQESNQ